MIEESFNEKCDKVLLYLLNIYKNSVDVHPLTHINKLDQDIGIRSADEVIQFLAYQKKFIRIDTKTAYLNISPKGIAFISHSSFVKEQKRLDTETTLKWYEQENAKKVFEDYPVIDKRSKWALWISVALLLLELVRWITAR